MSKDQSPKGNARVSRGWPCDGLRGARSRVAPKGVILPVSEDVQSVIKSAPMVQKVHVNDSRIVESAGSDTSSGWHMNGVGEALVFTLKTGLRLKTGGLVYRPVPGR